MSSGWPRIVEKHPAVIEPAMLWSVLVVIEKYLLLFQCVVWLSEQNDGERGREAGDRGHKGKNERGRGIFEAGGFHKQENT